MDSRFLWKNWTKGSFNVEHETIDVLLKLAFRKKRSCLEVFQKLNFLGGMRSMWLWSIHFSLLDAGVVGALLLQLMWGLLAQYRGGADTNTGDDTACPWSGTQKPWEKCKYIREIQIPKINTCTHTLVKPDWMSKSNMVLSKFKKMDISYPMT